jgi:transposase-like protein
VWRILERRSQIESALRAKPRRVWPFATVARLFGISPSLLRKWVEQGLLSRFRRPSDQHRPGLTERAIRRFLDAVATESESGVELFRERARPAEEKCRKAKTGLRAREALSPAEFAARAGVAVTTVLRLLAEGTLNAWYPTPHRPKICTWMEKERRIRLTRKMAKKGR